ncbi:MAG: glucoronyl hydrolase [Hungatella sp.]|jgi:unsaturated chondroitin disaccharide hydrolase|nr:glucoronyl hydrolase [Hungatella sp.]MCI9636342.1 glucoronyl hydrolase [Hungatella sp.]
MAQTFDSLMKYPAADKEMAKKAMEEAVRIVRADLPVFTDHFPSSNSFGGFYEATENVEWTTGFWTGAVWLAYEYSKEECFKEAALVQVDSFFERIKNKIDVNHHDMGFLFSLSCVAAYKLAGSERGKEAALMAADHLAERYREKGQFLQAWGNVGEPAEYRLIIDCLLNLPILYWASEVTGERRYAQMAENHIKTAMKCILREDDSTYHTYFINMETGEPAYGVTHQGNRNNSAWARGQAWGIYGIALSYHYLRDDSYIDLFVRVTDFFIHHLPDDLIPYWDFDFDTGSQEPRDSSAAAVAVCGILEMIKYLDEDRAKKYKGAADRIMAALIEKCGNRDLESSNGILLHGTYARDSKENTCKDRGVDECNTWGDYFYMEALTRMLSDWKMYW